VHENPFEAVGGPDADAIFGTEAEAGEAASSAVYFRVEVGESESGVLMSRDEGFAIGEAGGGGSESLVDGLVEERGVRTFRVTKHWSIISAAGLRPGCRLEDVDVKPTPPRGAGENARCGLKSPPHKKATQAGMRVLKRAKPDRGPAADEASAPPKNTSTGTKVCATSIEA
jgi:hypothetical protein